MQATIIVNFVIILIQTITTTIVSGNILLWNNTSFMEAN